MSEWKAYPVESLGIVRMIAHPTTGSDSDLLDDEKVIVALSHQLAAVTSELNECKEYILSFDT